jgi:hypothetical protein
VEVVDRELQLMRSGRLPDGKFAEGIFEQPDDGRRPLQAGVIDGAVID